MAEKTLTIKKMYAEQILSQRKEVRDPPCSEQVCEFEDSYVGGLALVQASTTSDPPSFNHGVWVGGEMPEHIGRGESSSWIKHGGCLRILVACNMMSVISSWPHEISYVCFLIFYSHNLSHRQDSYGRLGPNYNGAVLALELEPVSWLEDVEPKTQKRHPEVKKKSKPVVLKKPSKWVWGDMTWHLMDTCIKTSLEACHLPPWPSVVRAFKPAACQPSNP